MNELERRQRRLDRARFLIRAELLFAVAVPVLVGFLFITALGDVGTMFPSPAPLSDRFPPGVGVLTVGVLGYVLGLAWMIRLSRPSVEAGGHHWRYRDVGPKHLDVGAHGAGMTYEERQRRMDRARSLIRGEIAIGVVTSVAVWFLFIASPGNCMCPMFASYEPPLLQRLLPWVPVAGSFVGLVWMFWLSRPRVEAGERDWRYRAWRD